MKLLTFVLALAVCFAASNAQAQDFEVQVTPDFYEDEVTFTGEWGTVWVARWYVVPSGEYLAVCGLGFFRDMGFRGTIRDMLEDAEFYVNGQGYPIDLSFFGRARRMAELETGTASCRTTQVPLAGVTSVGLRLGPGMYRN